ncbi:MAG: 50S ribosomal protein L23 [Zetaproteobacteria bacterium]|nr:50S ribosomal protein L23 [Pseudobdellovibrionaceae bacterium]
MNPYSVLNRPVLTEKSNTLKDVNGKYTFLVSSLATKHDVKSAVQKVFGVDVSSVNTSIRRGKSKRRGMHVGWGAKQKKAVVTLGEGQKIAAFEEN